MLTLNQARGIATTTTSTTVPAACDLNRTPRQSRPPALPGSFSALYPGEADENALPARNAKAENETKGESEVRSTP